jgi:hypothetical protein
MARIRSIKPDFWTSEQIMECSPNARLMFIGLWNFCDDHGRHPLAPKQIKALLFPSDDITADDVSRMFGELSANDLLTTYSVDGKEYFQVTGWHHQKIDKPQKPKYPAPLQEHSPNGIDGKELIGEHIEEGSEAKASGATAPIDFEKLAFERGKEVLGKSAGGVVARLKREKCKTWPATLAVIEEAATKASPMEWVQGVLRQADPDEAIYRNVI